MPNSLRQPGPRANLRHMAPSAGTQGPRGIPAGAQRVGKEQHVSDIHLHPNISCTVKDRSKTTLGKELQPKFLK